MTASAVGTKKASDRMCAWGNACNGENCRLLVIPRYFMNIVLILGADVELGPGK